MNITAKARATDPATSHLAAAKVTPTISTVRDRVKTILTSSTEPLSHDQIIGRYRTKIVHEGWSAAGDSTIRTRVSELVKLGEVEIVPHMTSTSNFGRVQNLWRAVDVQANETTV